jgi:hypothetical protein
MHRKGLNLRFRPVLDTKKKKQQLVFFWNEVRFTESRNIDGQISKCGCQENPRAVNKVSLTQAQRATCMHKITRRVFSNRQIPIFKYI